MTTPAPHKVAIIADAHFHDPEGDFGGVGIQAEDGRRLVLHPWAVARQAPRAVNQSRDALRAALETVAARGIRNVILAGDYSDDGQAENLHRLSLFLHRAAHDLGLRFYAIPGNHDLYAVAGKHVSIRYATAPGKAVLVTSDQENAPPDAIVTPAMRRPGQSEALAAMAAFGLFRSPDDLLWESPFGLSDRLEDRTYEARTTDGSVGHGLIDASYLVEPEPGLWLLMIDANVYEPRPLIDDPRRKRAFIDATDAGWAAVLRQKPFLLGWIADVTRRARATGKNLIAVSHYPVLPPFEGETDEEACLFGQSALTRRSPPPEAGEALAATGLRLHFGGHLHLLSERQIETAAGRLTDLSLPSISAFPPALTFVEAGPNGTAVEIAPLENVPPDPGIEALARAEGAPPAGRDFPAFLARQRHAHLTDRRLAKDLPPEMSALLNRIRTADLVALLGPWPLHGAAVGTFPDLSLADILADGLMLRTGGPLALRHIAPERLGLYRLLAAAYGDATANPADGPAAWLARFFWLVHLALERAGASADGDGGQIHRTFQRDDLDRLA